ncbi:hypothetical protein CDD80_5153 [Ophiocordyceps camponoti-rufipedis]|uniref:PHD-type domain-containing protein n=1 Tax=Ophiocordyceps camponoti-rufipedis TaxID=2004952 RepID=A0A2C5ZM81_9HYPO|nr:hypothetical protein CDD80_5153 [Ophiocordyceps camponoti-rufipedis]
MDDDERVSPSPPKISFEFVTGDISPGWQKSSTPPASSGHEDADVIAAASPEASVTVSGESLRQSPASSSGHDDPFFEAREPSPDFSMPQIEIEIPYMSLERRDEYVSVHSQVVELVREQLGDPDHPTFGVEFTDGRYETLSTRKLTALENGNAALRRFYNDMTNTSRKRKRASPEEWDSEMDYPASDPMDVDDDDDLDDDDDELHLRPRRSVTNSRVLRSRDASVRLTSRDQTVLSSDGNSDDPVSQPYNETKRQLRKRQQRVKFADQGTSAKSSFADAERDELAAEPQAPSEEDDDDFMPVVSDIAIKTGRKKKVVAMRRRMQSKRAMRPQDSSRKGYNEDDIEFEAPRRSSRATRNIVSMRDDVNMEDDDSFDGTVEKIMGVPKAISVKEIFQTQTAESPFSSVHMQTCHSCHGPRHQGQLVHCQGCSLSYHKLCLGPRTSREHVVTKIGNDDFVLQCRFCVDIYRKKAKKEYSADAPRHSVCQDCKARGQACKPFSEKKTSRQEEKLREENDGKDPVTPVSSDLINNQDLVLFRCSNCHRAWHLDHLPAAGKGAAVDSDVRSERLKDYMVDWQCNECSSVKHKVHRLVAWRPTNPSDSQLSVRPSFDLVGEDDKEYLVKWQQLSYAHCSWLPGAWIFGTCAPTMILSFAKRAAQADLLKLTTTDAVPEEFLLPDIVFSVKMKASAPKAKTKEASIANMPYVSKALIKFQGLGYDDVVWDAPPPPELKARHAAFQEAYLEHTDGKHFCYEPHSRIRDRVKAFKGAAFHPVAQQPAGLVRGKLMGYQLEGLNWMLGNYHDGRSVVLADEMGLGKTIQVISLVTSLVQDSPKCWPFLIVVPNSTCPNWRREFKQWAPGLRVVTYHGGKESQDLAYAYELFPEGSADMKAHVVIMSYDSAQDPKTKYLFQSVHWNGLVVDEGQRLKNDQNLLYLALRAMKIPFRLLLTGTPLQNNKRELFNLLQFIDETQDAAALDQQYQVLDKKTLPKLHEKIRPFFLRRTKLGVLKFLPPMAQIILPVTMTVIQEKLAKSIMAKNPQLIKSIFANNKLSGKERSSLNNILMQLRKCLCHPFMYSDAIEERDHDPAVVHRNLVEASAKLLLLEIMLPKLKERGHRVLIFSQFLQQLDILEDFLSGIGYQYRRLDGSMSSLEKQRRIDAFNAPDSPIFAFLLSTRAGGVGINLATADTVIIMDPDFNPHQDIQALSRAHRIGQKKKVLCFQLMTKDTPEERIMEMGRKKMALDHALIESMDDDQLAGDDLESILKHGAQALFDENFQKTAIHYDEQSIIDLLDRSQAEQTKTDDDGSAETQFSYARVWANEKGGFSEGLDTAEDQAPEPVNSSVWDRILAEREEEASREAEANKEVLGRGGRRRMAINYKANAIEGVLPEAIGPDSSDASDEFAGANSSDDSDEDEERRKGKGRKTPLTHKKTGPAVETPIKKRQMASRSNVDVEPKQKAKKTKRTAAERCLPTPKSTPRKAKAGADKPAAKAKNSKRGPQKDKTKAKAEPREKQQSGTPKGKQQLATPPRATRRESASNRSNHSDHSNRSSRSRSRSGPASVSNPADNPVDNTIDHTVINPPQGQEPQQHQQFLMGNGFVNPQQLPIHPQNRLPGAAASEVQLRLAIDDVRHSPSNPKVKEERIEVLLSQLRSLYRYPRQPRTRNHAANAGTVATQRQSAMLMAQAQNQQAAMQLPAQNPFRRFTFQPGYTG